jgi:2-dehydropantoate 2-reductase
LKITIIGPGAIGCLFSAYLAKSKEEVWLLDKNEERTKKIRNEGIKIEGVSGSWQIKVNITTVADEIGKTDLVIVCVKSYDTKEAIQRAKSLIKDDSCILTLQNGLGNMEIISEIVGQERVVAGVTNQGATLLDIGVIRHAGKGETVIGRSDGRINSQLKGIKDLFNSVGIETRISKDIKGILWSKLIINCGINALTAIMRLNNGRLIEFETTRRILREAVTEAVKVTKRKKIKLIYDDPLAKVEAVCEATAQNISSMLQDILKKKRTEIDYINGVIVRQGQSLGIPTPVNSLLVDLVKTIEATYNLRVE